MTNHAPGWDLWRAFDAAMEERTLSGAARRLGLTQPTLGRQIEALEEALGFSLFVRSQKGLSPTENALGVAPLARNMAQTADAMLRASKGAHNEDRGTVRVTASEVMAARILPDMLAEFAAEYPEIELELHVSNTVDNLLAREADIAVRMVEPDQQALVSRKIGELDIQLFAHKDYIARNGMPAGIDDIDKHRLIGYDESRYPWPRIRETGFDMRREHFTIRTDNDMTQQALVVAGAGIGGMPPKLARQYPDLVPVLHNRFRMPLGCWLVMHEDLRHARPTRLLFDHLAEGLKAYVNAP